MVAFADEGSSAWGGTAVMGGSGLRIGRRPLASPRSFPRMPVSPSVPLATVTLAFPILKPPSRLQCRRARRG
eukprot:9389955-Pyramimonas_sp.AAC.1